jgi:hypothetical protein
MANSSRLGSVTLPSSSISIESLIVRATAQPIMSSFDNGDVDISKHTVVAEFVHFMMDMSGSASWFGESRTSNAPIRTIKW